MHKQMRATYERYIQNTTKVSVVGYGSIHVRFPDLNEIPAATTICVIHCFDIPRAEFERIYLLNKNHVNSIYYYGYKLAPGNEKFFYVSMSLLIEEQEGNTEFNFFSNDIPIELLNETIEIFGEHNAESIREKLAEESE